MRFVHILVGAVFFDFAYLQFNDPDPLYWVTVYGATGIVAIAHGFGRSSRVWTAVVTGGISAGMLIAAPSMLDYVASGNPGSLFESMGYASYVEPAREFLGLTIAFAALSVYASASRQKT